jgi:hypothetical protein
MPTHAPPTAEQIDAVRAMNQPLPIEDWPDLPDGVEVYVAPEHEMLLIEGSRVFRTFDPHAMHGNGLARFFTVDEDTASTICDQLQEGRP